MAGLTVASRLGVRPFEESEPVELRQNWTEADLQAIIKAAYSQVFGNEHLMSSERQTSAESLLRQGLITVRDFVRVLAKSEVYRQKFLYPNSQTRAIELNYKHLLGRAPYDKSEIAYHVDLYNDLGYEEEIDSYIDSLEYEENFGDSIVPYYRGFQTQKGQKTVGFGRIFQLYQGYANSDRAQGQTQSKLTWELAKNLASPITTPSSGQGLAGTAVGSRGQLYRVRVFQKSTANSPQIRRSTADMLVPYEGLSAKLQQLDLAGKKVLSITPA